MKTIFAVAALQTGSEAVRLQAQDWFSDAGDWLVGAGETIGEGLGIAASETLDGLIAAQEWVDDAQLTACEATLCPLLEPYLNEMMSDPDLNAFMETVTGGLTNAVVYLHDGL